MGESKDLDIEPERWYLASEAAPLVKLKEATLKKKLRDKEIIGEQIGARMVWHVQGVEIIAYRKKWNLDIL